MPEKRLLMIAVLCLSACATTYVSSERVSNIVANIRSASAKGFADITIDYVKPDLKVSGHAISNVRLAALMKTLEQDGMTLRVQDLHMENLRGRHTMAFTIVASGVGDIQDWSGPIIEEFPFSLSSTHRLSEYSLIDLVYVGMRSKAGIVEVFFRAPDKSTHRLRKGDRVGSENATIDEIEGRTLILQKQDGQKYVMQMIDETN